MVKFFGFIFKWLIIFAVWGGFILAAVIFYYCHDLPNLKDMENANDKQVIEVLYSNGNKIAVLGDLYANQVTFNQLPGHLIDAVVAVEDRKFFTHSGFDVSGIARALYVNIKAEKIVQGGSTITQQLAKMMFLDPERTMKRKIQELILAWQLERTFSKEQILTLYLNRAYFGAGNYGVASASRYYFGKPVSKLNLNESALLAGVLKAPSRLSPSNSHKLAKRRVHQVLEKMADAGYLDVSDAKEIMQPIAYKNDKLQRFYFSDYVGNSFSNYLLKSDKSRNNRFSIRTTLDENLQKTIEEETVAFVKSHNKRIGKSEIALVLMSKDGAIKAMIGGKDYQKSPFNRAIASKRQAGSAFKIFVYLTAFQNGYKPNDKMEDKKVTLGGWSPENYEKKYYGKISLEDAFAKSVNSIPVQLAAKLDKKEILRNALKMGITSEINSRDATFVLGTAQVSLLEMVNAYASIASDGIAVLPYFITTIHGDEDRVLYENKNDEKYRIIDEDYTDYMKDLLRKAVKSGTGKAANIGWDIHGKTGTSQKYRDAWFIGFDNKYVLGIWIGNDDNSSTNRITGGDLPAQLFAKIMKKID